MENDLYVDSILKAEGLSQTDSLLKANYIREVYSIEGLDNTSVVVFILFFIVSLYVIYKYRK
jgi:hypothetical protein